MKSPKETYLLLILEELRYPKCYMKKRREFPLPPPSPPESRERGKVREKSGRKMDFTAGEFLRADSQTF